MIDLKTTIQHKPICACVQSPQSFSINSLRGLVCLNIINHVT